MGRKSFFISPGANAIMGSVPIQKVMIQIKDNRGER